VKTVPTEAPTATVVLIPVPAGIKTEPPTEWKVVNTPEGKFYAITSDQYEQLLIWLADTTRYVREASLQIEYYRNGIEDVRSAE